MNKPIVKKLYNRYYSVMELRCKRKMLFLVLSVCIVFSVVFTETLSADNHDHDCTGSECPICLIIEAGHNFLKTLKFIGFLFFAALLTFLARIPARNTWINAYNFSPVTLKVRFNS